MAAALITDLIGANKVMVFSKSYCPYCSMAKSALSSVTSDFKVLEIESRSDCDAIQDELKKMTGARSVPRVFINGTCIGGGSETQAALSNGSLVRMLKDAGVTVRE